MVFFSESRLSVGVAEGFLPDFSLLNRFDIGL